jgi:ABC-2 type transport system ATP-binding protein
METKSAAVIKTQDLSKTYGEVQALNHLNLRVPEHAIFGFLGPNGAGKTTTMKILLGLVKPTNGRGTIFGKDIQRENLDIRERIGYLPQHPRFIEYMTARELLDFTARFYLQGPENEIQNRIQDMLALVSLEDKADRPVKGFSGGEKQRLGIALAQVNKPDLLILDEPAAALDPLGRHQVLEVMARLREHTTVFYSTHILDDVQKVSDTVAILKDGALVAQGPIEDLLQGQEGTVYTVTTRGHPPTLENRLTLIPWVSEVRLTALQDGVTTWEIHVEEEKTAEEHLLRSMLRDQQIVITEFHQKRFELEEIFIDIVEGSHS